MKYSELHKKLKKAGCYLTGKDVAGHPQWYTDYRDKIPYKPS